MENTLNKIADQIDKIAAELTETEPRHAESLEANARQIRAQAEMMAKGIA